MYGEMGDLGAPMRAHTPTAQSKLRGALISLLPGDEPSIATWQSVVPGLLPFRIDRLPRRGISLFSRRTLVPAPRNSGSSGLWVNYVDLLKLTHPSSRIKLRGAQTSFIHSSKPSIATWQSVVSGLLLLRINRLPRRPAHTTCTCSSQ